jgi:hypothetical protein
VLDSKAIGAGTTKAPANIVQIPMTAKRIERIILGRGKITGIDQVSSSSNELQIEKWNGGVD